MDKTTKIQRTALARAFSGKKASVCFETYALLHGAGLIREIAGGPSLDLIEIASSDLTPEGEALGREEHAKIEATRKRSNAGARSRAAAYRELGMKRTPYGWE